MSLWFAPPIKQSTFLEKGEWVGNVNPYNEAGLSAHYQSVLSKIFKNDQFYKQLLFSGKKIIYLKVKI